MIPITTADGRGLERGVPHRSQRSRSLPALWPGLAGARWSPRASDHPESLEPLHSSRVLLKIVARQLVFATAVPLGSLTAMA